jgi:hypothetical protein
LLASFLIYDDLPTPASPMSNINGLLFSFIKDMFGELYNKIYVKCVIEMYCMIFCSILCIGRLRRPGPRAGGPSIIYYITNWYSMLCGNIPPLFSICLGISVIKYVYREPGMGLIEK